MRHSPPSRGGLVHPAAGFLLFAIATGSLQLATPSSSITLGLPRRAAAVAPFLVPRPPPTWSSGLNGTLPSLGRLASKRGLHLGAALIEHVLAGQPSADRTAYGNLFGNTDGAQFYIASPDSAFKWHWLEPSDGNCNWNRSDAAVAAILFRNISVRGSAGGVWPIHNPPWLSKRARSLSPLQLRAVLVKHMASIVGRYKGRVGSWDVVNEPLINFPPSSCGKSNWSCALFRSSTWTGSTPVDWTRIEPRPSSPEESLGAGAYLAASLQAARTADPAAILMLNEYDIHSLANNKTHLFLAMLEDLVKAGAALDGVGIQMHLEDKYSTYSPTALAEVIDRINVMGLDVHISELDMAPSCSRCYANATTPAEKLARQGEIYASVLHVCLAAKRCSALVMWSARPAPSPSPYFVPGLPHTILIKLRQVVISYQDNHMLLLAFAGLGCAYRPRRSQCSARYGHF